MNTKDKDKLLLEELFKKNSLLPKDSRNFRNSEIREKFSEVNNLEDLNKLEEFLASKDVFNLNLEEVSVKDLDDEILNLSLARAATTDMWPMGTHCWIKDNSLIADRLLNYSDSVGIKNPVETGKKILKSCLDLMSSISQLDRFKNIITGKSNTKAENWPYIFMGFNNLNASKTEEWNHIQIAWQFLAIATYRALEKGLLKPEELSQKNKTFLSLSIPFLLKVGFPNYENAGCWEEIIAERLSTMSIDQTFLTYSRRFLSKENFTFLSDIWRDLTEESLKNQLNRLDKALNEGLLKITSKIPFESANYDKTHVKYREADMALIYFLQYSDVIFKDKEEINKYNSLVLEQVNRLFDKDSLCIKRYSKDSYQRQGYFRNETAEKLQEMYEGLSGEFSSLDSFSMRDKIVADGREAGWTQSAWQLSAWAGKEYRRTMDSKFSELQKEMFLNGLKTITGESEFSIDLNENGEANIIKIPAFQNTGMLHSDINDDGEELIFPTPHTPLNWSIGEAISAFASLRQVLENTTL